MIIAQIPTLRTEDFPTQKEWISRLLFPLNQFISAAATAVNGNVTFGDNVPGQTTTLKFTYGGTTDFPKAFKWNLVVKPIELRVCQATENDVAVALVAAWSYSQSLVSVSNLFKLSTAGVVGLTQGASYNITLRAQP
jgi:hypothetical protein